MRHEKTVIYFSSKTIEYKVQYENVAKTSIIRANGNLLEDHVWEYDELEVSVYKNDILIKKFDSKPYTKTVNPTKTQAKELLSLAIKSWKEENAQK